MRKTFSLAKLGEGQVSPNPLVGAIIVDSNLCEVSVGYHSKAGEDHAEIMAMKNSHISLKGLTLFCNLEPCCHENKKTPPCVEQIINSGISRVVISTIDPNPMVSGNGIKRLREAGIEVIEGVLQEEGEKLNNIFFKYMRTGLPYVHLKTAQSLDGFICTENGDSKWITSEESRRFSHFLRKKYDAVIIGRETLNKDNPSLTIRMDIDANDKVPVRVVLGNPSKMNLNSNLFNDSYSFKTIIMTKDEVSQEEMAFFDSKKVRVMQLPNDSDFLKNVLIKLAKREVTSVLVEGGSTLASSFVEQGLFDCLTVFQAPILLGKGKSPFQDLNVNDVSGAFKLVGLTYQKIGQDIMVEYSKKANS